MEALKAEVEQLKALVQPQTFTSVLVSNALDSVDEQYDAMSTRASSSQFQATGYIASLYC